jgi:Mrp family chromosome partitioning ATPase
MDRRLHSSDRIEAIFGLPTMARIPGLALGNGREGRERSLVTLDAASSIGAESFRNLRTNVRFVREGRGASEIVITSPSPGEGKSLTAANLAVALAQQDRSTLLIDADMRRPIQHQKFNVEPSPGLSETLLADELREGAIRSTMLDSLFILPAGRLPPNPAELLAVDKTRFRLSTIDENGAPISTTVRTFVNRNTMVNEVGRITFHRVDPGANAPLF